MDNPENLAAITLYKTEGAIRMDNPDTVANKR